MAKHEEHMKHMGGKHHKVGGMGKKEKGFGATLGKKMKGKGSLEGPFKK
jgi:hypothetical protein